MWLQYFCYAHISAFLGKRQQSLMIITKSPEHKGLFAMVKKVSGFHCLHFHGKGYNSVSSKQLSTCLLDFWQGSEDSEEEFAFRRKHWSWGWRTPDEALLKIHLRWKRFAILLPFAKLCLSTFGELVNIGTACHADGEFWRWMCLPHEFQTYQNENSAAFGNATSPFSSRFLSSCNPAFHRNF